MDAGEISAEDLAGYDGLIVGCPTWNTGADEYRSGTAWDDLLDEIKGIDLAGKPVAVFGCGDSQGYGDNFCDGIEELHETFAAAGAKMVGYVDAGAYQHAESKSTRGDKFLGLPLDLEDGGLRGRWCIPACGVQKYEGRQVFGSPVGSGRWWATWTLVHTSMRSPKVRGETSFWVSRWIR